MLAGLRLAQADATELGIDEDRIGHQAVVDRRAAAFQQIGADDPEVVVGDVGERGPALHVA